MTKVEQEQQSETDATRCCRWLKSFQKPLRAKESALWNDTDVSEHAARNKKDKGFQVVPTGCRAPRKTGHLGCLC